ncbi:MAG: TatD family hydrolase [Candidatus Omnitrophota bacterium]
MLFDTHCHLDSDDFNNDLAQVLIRARNNNVEFMLNAGCSLQSSRKAIELSNSHKNIFSAAGIHPHFAGHMYAEMWEEFDLITREKISAIGECGLDFYRKLASPEKQYDVFIKQILMSKKLNLPLIIHSRQAEKETIAVLKEYDVIKAVAHCFSGSAEYLEFCIERKFFVSFAGNLTYPKALSLKEAAAKVPLDLLLIETDSPFLSPEPVRGKRCEPAFIVYTRDEISRIKGVGSEKIEEITTENALRCFNI